jgi:mannose-6-phosphate isomerase
VSALVSRLDNAIMPYAWGNREFLSTLQQRSAPGTPEAELWMGAHAKAPSKLDNGKSLLEHVQANAPAALGEVAVHHFGRRLPFLLKVLAAEKALSIQVHPTRAQAAAGFEREQSASPPGLYSDAGDKPELLCALTPFEVLCGFRPSAEAAAVLRSHGQSDLAQLLEAHGIAQAFENILRADSVLTQHRLAQAVAERGEASDLVNSLAEQHSNDAGILAALLLNHFVVPAGQAIFLPAGVVHAYLRGAGIELMGNSDNVLRGGLTTKHVDVGELLRVVSFEPRPVELLKGEGNPESVFRTPAESFQLSRITLSRSMTLSRRSADILLVERGTCSVAWRAGRLDLRQGQSLFADFAAGELTLSGDGIVFRATTP